ncbi:MULTISPECIES: hypothetical protein [Candidatus Cryosericum]|jgi:hypothetical protein|uniref:hypothetical protein n=1 Tax=Candidatus Cryosericum TaxID=2498709 RepID=UPI001FB2C9DE|nr:MULTISPECIES: hypothetical protein [Cryosericum]
MSLVELYQIHRMGKSVGRKVYHTVLLTASAEEQAAREERVARLRQALASARP